MATSKKIVATLNLGQRQQPDVSWPMPIDITSFQFKVTAEARRVKGHAEREAQLLHALQEAEQAIAWVRSHFAAR